MDGDLRIPWDSGLAMPRVRRYKFDGQMVTVAELAERVTCYSERWLAEALKAGCRSVRDLAVRYYEGGQRKRAGEVQGRRGLRKFVKG